MTEVIDSTSQSQLKSTIERIERLLEDKKSVQEDIKEVYLEAKGAGFETKIIRKIIKLRSISKAARDEEEALLDLYASAIGGL